jgi:hypothetical protein
MTDRMQKTNRKKKLGKNHPKKVIINVLKCDKKRHGIHDMRT